MTKEEITTFLGRDWTRTQDVFRAALFSEIPLLRQINDEVCMRTGKQLRPMVCLLVARACADGPLGMDSCRFAAAAELLHNATLMHDDVADKSPERRGKPTLVAKVGPSSAVLVGDFWLSKAVQEVLRADKYESVARLFSKTLSDLAEGEMIQLQNAATCNTTMQDYLKVIYCKTTSLFESACLSGAFSAGADARQEDAVRHYANALGNAFQIKDDILDYCGGEALGKPMGADIRDRKITLPLLGAFENAPEKEMEIRSLIRNIPSQPGNCDKVREFVLNNGGVEYAYARLDEYVKKAEVALNIFEESQQKEYLVQIARYNSSRQI